MKILILSPVILSLLILSAHFYRAEIYLFSLTCIVFTFLLFIKRSWIARLIQLMLVLGSLEWIRTLYFFAEERKVMGEPWTRLVIILGGIALFTALSALIFQIRSMKEHYKIGNT
jgi:hypothetical protein